MLVATVQALKHHGGDPDGGLAALERGAANLAAQHRDRARVRARAVVAVNRFPEDTTARARTPCGGSRSKPAPLAAAVNDGYRAAARARSSWPRPSRTPPTEHRSRSSFLYALEDPLRAKIEQIATRAYGAAGIELSPEAAATGRASSKRGASAGLPVCIAKTHLSLSHDPTLPDAPAGFTLPVRELRAYTGAGWVVAALRRDADDARPARRPGRLASRRRPRRADPRPALIRPRAEAPDRTRTRQT